MAFTYKIKVGGGPAMANSKEEILTNVKVNFSLQKSLSFDANMGPNTPTITFSVPEVDLSDSNPIEKIFDVLKSFSGQKALYATISVLNGDEYIDLVTATKVTNVYMYCSGNIDSSPDAAESQHMNNEITINFETM